MSNIQANNTDLGGQFSGVKCVFFDVNETLLDISPAKALVSEKLHNRDDLAELWFHSLLHYSLTDTVTGTFHSFGEIGSAVLQMIAQNNGIFLQETSQSLAEVMVSLPAYPDVASGLAELKAQGLELVALTNSGADKAAQQLEYAGLAEYFDHMLGVDQIEVYKPDLRVYEWATKTVGVAPGEAMMVAAHGWDVYGAGLAGMRTAFVARQGEAPYLLAPEPDVTVACIGDLKQHLPAIQ